MLNELITWVLNTYLGKYLENFNPAQLSVALLSGEVELENIPIRKDALRSLGVPIQAISGNIGKIKLQIPVRQFRTAPWCVIIEHVYGVLAPNNLDEWDDEKEKLSELEFKLAELDAKEAKLRVDLGYQTDNFYSSSYSSWINYGTSLATNILENLELKIRDVHLRYEDNVTIKNVPFAAGIKIGSLTAQSCNANWDPGSVNSNKHISYKLIELKDLSLYWDRLREENICSHLSSKDLILNMKELCNEQNHYYIISPISATAKCKRERCKQAIRSKLRPRLSCELFIPEVKVSCSDFQYKQIVDCTTGLHLINTIRCNRLKRPQCSVKENAILWWKYAAQCHGFTHINEEQKWIILKENLRYIKIYKRLLLNPNENISIEETHFKLDVEKTRTLNELQNLRGVCFTNVYTKELALKTRNINQGKSMLFHWFPNWWGWYGNNDVANQIPPQDDAYKNIEDDFLNALEDTLGNDSFSKRDAVFCSFTLVLSDGLFVVNTEDPISGVIDIKLELEFKNLLSIMEMKPRYGSHLIGLSLGSVCVKDKLTKQTEFPYIIKPQTTDAHVPSATLFPLIDNRIFTKNYNKSDPEPWFQLQYQSRPVEIQSDYRLIIKSRSLDIVYNKHLIEWLIAFVTKPFTNHNNHKKAKMEKDTNTRLKFLKNWKQLLVGYKENRKTWSFEIDISAPRIMFVENYLDKNSSLVLVDFGRFLLLKNELRKDQLNSISNGTTNGAANDNEIEEKNSEDDELFMTPCSTPPGSEISYAESPTVCHDASNLVVNSDNGLESAFHDKIYDKYTINLTDLQVLLCKNQEYGYGNFRNSSNFYLLDKFDISLQLEQRVIYTADPEYPLFTLYGTLPKIVAHINEQKINETLKILKPITLNSLFTLNSHIGNDGSGDDDDEIDGFTLEEDSLNAEPIVNKNIAKAQFVIGQIILELQSYEKSIAELQIIGARAGVAKLSDDTHITMSVHGLLLVDAIQAFGPDFELLVASHRHVGMDSISGSLKQSEPCSPTSPGSPDPMAMQRPTSPFILNKAINNLRTDFNYMDALITVDVNFIENTQDGDTLRIASINFNNLDIIANQETVVELLGFMKRIQSSFKIGQTESLQDDQLQLHEQDNKEEKGQFPNFRTEISFDFNRLNILVMRTVKKENCIVARKVGTLTMTEAKIHATLDNEFCVSGSLGGLQVIDITPEGINHQRIFSVGKDPLTDPPDLHKPSLLSTISNEMYGGHHNGNHMYDEINALIFKISNNENSPVDVNIRMASVWYTHCPNFIQEINVCISQFKHYLKNFAKSLRNKASDMVNNTLNIDKMLGIKMDVILNSPVIVLPRSSQSSDVLVANLGKITAYNNIEESEISATADMEADGSGINVSTTDNYFVDIRNINLFSLNTSQRKYLSLTSLPKANELYSCKNDAVAILYDTAMSFKVTKYSKKIRKENVWHFENIITVKGSVTQLLQISLSRIQYKQLTESLCNAIKFHQNDHNFPKHNPTDVGLNTKDNESNTEATFSFSNDSKTIVKFLVPAVKINLKNEHNNSLIDITFRAFSIKYHQRKEETTLQILLKSILMEDLKCAENSKFRNMVESSAQDEETNMKVMNKKFSTSCPNLQNLGFSKGQLSISMPNRLHCVPFAVDTNVKCSSTSSNAKNLNNFPSNKSNLKEPDKNLVIYKSKYIQKYNADNVLIGETDSSIDFNCLNLTISVDRWFMVLDFFGLLSDNGTDQVDSHKFEIIESNIKFKNELNVHVRCLNLILVRNEKELSKANISNASFTIIKENIVRAVEGCLGSISLYDLTRDGHLYREKFSTAGPEALHFYYKRLNDEIKCSDNRSLEKDAVLHIQMSSVRYIHTKRFLAELHLFVKELLQLQSPVIRRIKMAESEKDTNSKELQIGLKIHAASPIVLLPLSNYSNQVIIVDLGEFTLKNEFHLATDECIISKIYDVNAMNVILDVMYIDLVNINLYAGEKMTTKPHKYSNSNEHLLDIGNMTIVKQGTSIFKETCYLKLQCERNTETAISHNCSDISIKGTLSKLNGIVNLQQYKLIRGFLNYNLGETIDDIYYNYTNSLCESIERLNHINKVNQSRKDETVWNIMSVNFQLENVSILLTEQATFEDEFLPLACINFIKSSLEIDSFSDGSQDIDLIFREILIVDSRPDNVVDVSANNVFKHLLEPAKHISLNPLVQAEVHSRKRAGSAKYTILLNNMRMMTILDCVNRIKDFLQEEPHVSASYTKDIATSHEHISKLSTSKEDNSTPFEVVLNITDSELVFVENISKPDTNAVIMKSTTVVSYKPNQNVPVSVNINHLEIFSCIIGAEDDSALSIIDPFTLNMELRNNCLYATIQKQLCIRLSYNDGKLFTKMLQMIPKQNKSNTTSDVLANKLNDSDAIAPLIAMGFTQRDALLALEMHNYKLNDAALWLSQQKQIKHECSSLDIHSVVLNLNCVSICVIDDCMDADVPLLEILLSNLMVNQRLRDAFSDGACSDPNAFEGHLEATIMSDYYNRRLSGWEPVIESCECSAKWKYSEGAASKKSTMNLCVSSKHLVKLNITSTLIELCDMVKNNWTQDYFSSTPDSALRNADGLAYIRRRSPFVPFALQNLTGEQLFFKTFISEPGGITRTEVQDTGNWMQVQHNANVPFDFGPQTKLRHMNSHKLNLHQIFVQINGCTMIGPISIDKVGVFFRNCTFDLGFMKKTRIVFDITLVGSAQKLITVRSALSAINKTNESILLKMQLDHEQQVAVSVLKPNESLKIPLRLIDALIYVKPFSNHMISAELCEQIERDKFVYVNKDNKKYSPLLSRNNNEGDFSFCTRGICWGECTKDTMQDIYSCCGPNNDIFHIWVEIRRDKYSNRDVANITGHTITLLPPLKIKNMLSCSLLFKIGGAQIYGTIPPSNTVDIYAVNVNNSFNLSITLDNYKLSGQLKIPMGHTGVVEPKLKLIDLFNRELYLRVSIQLYKGKSMEIYISAPVWLINRTGLPLVFRQENSNQLASGQFDEHEKARVVSPLLFSFSDSEGSPSLQIRLGNCYGNDNPWCKSFNLHRNINYRELRTERARGCYAIGINVRRGRALYACTTFVTLSPRFQMYNKTSHKLEFAQKCDIIKNETTTAEKIISALPDCNFPFHWPECEQEPLLCVRIADVEFCRWSNGIPINEIQSLYINMRNDLGEMYFLRLEVFMRGATYILLFSDAHILPPPIRIDNYSEVVLHFFQYGSKPCWRTPVRPRSSLAYALDDPLGLHSLKIEAPGGNSIEFPLQKFEVSRSITYANFIYIAFRETFKSVIPDDDAAENDIEAQQLVLGVKDRRVYIMRKCTGDRSQLWLMNSNGQLEHEGSSPPSEYAKSGEQCASRMVLDVEKAPNPREYTTLVVRPRNKQRITTQTWRFENGRLMCHANLCVQARDGVYGLRPGCEAVLGCLKSKSRIKNDQSIPFEQSIEIQKLRPGSGHLEVMSQMDGPIRTVKIKDVKSKSTGIMLSPDPTWNHASFNNNTISDGTHRSFFDEFSLKLELQKGLGLSVISRQPCDELVYITFDNITCEIFSTPFVKSFNLKVSDLQIDNQLLETSCPVLLHTSKVDYDSLENNALVLRAKMLPSPNENAVIFEYLSFDLKPCAVYLEERLLLKAAAFLGYGKLAEDSTTIELEYEAPHHIDEKSLSTNFKRFYFENLIIGPTQIRLTVMTAPKLTAELLELKKSIGLTLIKFEDAIIDFQKFGYKHHFETLDVYLKAIKEHYINQLKWHAASILGSVDFLGNPLGFVNDLSEGVSDFILEGSVKSLVKNAAHGISNSTAKLTETLSDSLGRVVLDDHDNETRQKILEISSNSSGGHLAAGLKGFGFGLLGGVTSIVRHTYVGAQSGGFPGFISGFGKGLLGTVTKPIIGVLDLASETATAVRETSRSSNRIVPERKRLPRCITGAPGGLLPTYSYRQSRGQQYLYVINRRNFAEKIISYEPNLCNNRESKLRLLVTSEYIRIFSRCDEDPAIMFECHLSEVLSCHPLTTNAGASSSTTNKHTHYYIEISTNLPKITRPRVRCQNEEIAERAARSINYAKGVFDEGEQSIVNE